MFLSLAVSNIELKRSIYKKMALILALGAILLQINAIFYIYLMLKN